MQQEQTSNDARKLALIIGQNNYQFLEQLVLSISDAQVMKKTLQNIGFQVTMHTDTTNAQMEEAFIRFSSKLEEGDLVFFYYSGHANQQTIKHKTDNYLYGIDAKKETKGGVDVTQGVALNRKIFSRWLNETCRYLIVLDACRIYPNNHEQFKAGTSGQMSGPVTPEMTLVSPSLPDKIKHREYDVVYACQPGYGAIEDKDREAGFLASAFKSALSKSCTWTDALFEVIKSVKKDTSSRQNPNISWNISEKIYFKNSDTENTSKFGNSTSDTKPTILEEPPMPQNILQPAYNDENSCQVSFVQFEQSLKNGLAQNQFLPVDSMIEPIRSGLFRQIASVHLKEVKILSSTQQSYFEFLIPLQKIEIEDCIFEGIGLRVQAKQISLKRVHVCQAPYRGIVLENSELVQTEVVRVENCEGNGICLYETQQAIVKKVNIRKCFGGMYEQKSENSDIQNVDVEDCMFAFWFYESDAEIKNCRYRNCENGIYEFGECQIASENVREIVP